MRRANKDDATGAILLVGGLILAVGVWIATHFRIPLGLGIVAAVLLAATVPLALILLSRSNEQRARERADQQARECTAWLASPEGVAWQVEQGKRLNAQREEQERLRIEDERRDRAAEEEKARDAWARYHESKTMSDVDRMSGTEFEQFLARLFSRMGYTEITLTPNTDQGADLVCRTPGGRRVAVQAKRWKARVGNRSVQEVVAAMGLYDCAEGMVVTNSTFTPAAVELARANDVTLHDRCWLAARIKEYLPPSVPEFNWDEYRKLEAVSAPGRAVPGGCHACGAPTRRIKSKRGRGYFLGCTRYPQCRATVACKKLKRQQRDLSSWDDEFLPPGVWPSYGESPEPAKQAPRPGSAEQGRPRVEVESPGPVGKQNRTVTGVAQPAPAEPKPNREESRPAESPRKDQGRKNREAAERARDAVIEREWAERLEQLKGSGLPRVWAQQYLDRWDQLTWDVAFDVLKGTPYWPVNVDAFRAYLSEIRDELLTQRDREREELRKQDAAKAVTRPSKDVETSEGSSPPGGASTKTIARVVAVVVRACRAQHALRTEELRRLVARAFVGEAGAAPTVEQIESIESAVVERLRASVIQGWVLPPRNNRTASRDLFEDDGLDDTDLEATGEQDNWVRAREGE